MTKKADELRTKNDGELQESLRGLERDFFMRRFTSDPKRIQNPGKYKNIRRQIARIRTVLRERDILRKLEETNS